MWLRKRIKVPILNFDAFCGVRFSAPQPKEGSEALKPATTPTATPEAIPAANPDASGAMHPGPNLPLRQVPMVTSLHTHTHTLPLCTLEQPDASADPPDDTEDVAPEVPMEEVEITRSREELGVVSELKRACATDLSIWTDKTVCLSAG